jgi:hypothetical protein
MKKQHKLAALLLVSALSWAQAAEKYAIEYRGIKLGEITDMTTLEQLYLKSKVTNFIAKLLLGKEYFVFYADHKPNITHAKFRKDKNHILLALREAIKSHPKHAEFPGAKKGSKLILECNTNICNYRYIKGGRITGIGKIYFDKKSKFYKLTEEKNKVVIKRK